MQYTVKDYYKRIRTNGATASRALQLAHDNYKAQRPLYDLPAPARIGYNPQSESGGRWIENAAGGLRLLGHADEVARHIQHKGGYSDEDGMGDTYRGVVYRLPARNGVEQFAYGYSDPCNEGAAYLVFDSAYAGDATGAAYAADRVAEKHAEREREYQEAWRAGTDYMEAGEELAGERKAALALLAEMRAARKGRADWASTEAICSALRATVQRHLRAIHKLREKRAELVDAYAPAWRGAQREAFNEGACATVLA